MISIGCDHAGFELKQEIIGYLEAKGLSYVDRGCFSPEAVDYPLIARLVARDVAEGSAEGLPEPVEKGILICGTGIGIGIAANKVPGIRCAICGDCFSAEAARLHNDANILALGARVTAGGLALKIVETFLNTPFSGAERHQRRIDLIEEA